MARGGCLPTPLGCSSVRGPACRRRRRAAAASRSRGRGQRRSGSLRPRAAGTAGARGDLMSIARGSSVASDPGGLLIRPARPDDIDGVLDLLTHYDQPRAAFEPWYEHDPTYRPEQSWLAETNGRLVAHLRIYPRQLRLGTGATMTVA